MDESLFRRILTRIQSNDITTCNFHEDKEFEYFLDLLYEDIGRFKNYTFDGRLQDIFFKGLQTFNSNDTRYGQFLRYIEEELNKLVVPCIILIPLNFLNNDMLESNLTLTENIKIFKTEKENTVQLLKESKKKSALSKYVETTIYAKLLKEHILLAKDDNFFNFPILTIAVNGIDYQVENESSIITEAVYSFIRMLDYEALREGSGRGILHRKHGPAGTYGVYYNKEGTSPKPPYTNGYGYSGRFKFSPYLDINSEEFIKQIDQFRDYLVRFCDNCFCDKRKLDKQICLKIEKWQKAVLLYNTAYELASIEKYNECLLLLIIILETMFLKKNEHGKQNALCNTVIPFMESNYNEIDTARLEKLIRDTYKKRSDFVHEGRGINYDYSIFKSLGNYQGIIQGMKPFVYGCNNLPRENCNLLHQLFMLVGDIIKKY